MRFFTLPGPEYPDNLARILTRIRMNEGGFGSGGAGGGSGSGGPGEGGGGSSGGESGPGGDPGGSGESGGSPGGQGDQGGAGSGGSDPLLSAWRDHLPEDIGTHASLADIKDVSSLAKSYVNAQALIGKKGVILPGDDAKPEDWASFFDQIGRPESADKYDLQPLADAPEGFTMRPEFDQGFRAMAHEHGLTGKQAAAAYEFLQRQAVGNVARFQENQAAAVKESWDALKKEWGPAFNDKLAAANRAAREYGGEDFLAHLKESGLGKNTTLLKVFAKAGAEIKEDDAGGGKGRSSALTPAEAKSKINALKGTDPKGAYWDKSHVQHKDVRDQVSALYKIAYPEEDGK